MSTLAAGFTLVELLMVPAIMTVVASIATALCPRLVLLSR